MTTKAKVLWALLVVATVLLVSAAAIVWSVNAYHTRHRGEHRDRLQRLVADHPTEAHLQQMFGRPWSAGPTEEIVTFARETWGQEFTVTPDLAGRSPRALLYQVEDMVYLLFLDSSGTMIYFVLLRN